MTADFVSFDETTVVPFEPETPAANADVTFILDLGRFSNLSYIWTLSGTDTYSEVLEDQTPLLFTPNSTAGLNSGLTLRTLKDQWVDIIILSTEELAPSHPIHKHSNKVYVIGQGTGDFNYSSVAEAMQYIPESFNLVNPPIQDTFSVAAYETGPTWVAARYQSINPGAFFIHCHVQTHLVGGMAVAILDGVDAFPSIPPEYSNGRTGF